MNQDLDQLKEFFQKLLERDGKYEHVQNYYY